MLNSNLAVYHESVSMSSFNGITMHFYKVGKLVVVTYAGNLTLSSANSFITLGNIPTGFLPLVETCITYAQINNGIKGTGRISFTTDGIIKAYVTLTGVYEAKFSTSYITE